jgi:hypothetical protein
MPEGFGSLVRARGSIVVVATVVLGACHSSPVAHLSYTTDPAVYTDGITVTPNAPRGGGDGMDAYAISPALPARPEPGRRNRGHLGHAALHQACDGPRRDGARPRG